MKNFETFIFLFIFIQLLFVAVYDVRHRKISNQWSLLNVGLFFGLLFIAPDMYALSLQTFMYSLIFLGLGLLTFALKIMGAGDSKYLFSLFLIAPAMWHEQMFSLLLISTYIIGGFSILTSVSQNFEKMLAYARSGYARGIKECLGNKFPYAPVIFMTWGWLGYVHFVS